MIKRRIVFGLTILFSFLVFCIKLPTQPDKQEFYFNSFEETSDISDWKGISVTNLKDDVPQNAGKKSVYISGGCIVPHASLELVNDSKDCHFKLSCWGKNLNIGGMVLLRTEGSSPKSISVTISDSSWTYYESKENIFCSANEKIIIEMNSGGIVAGGMLIDLLKIEKID